MKTPICPLMSDHRHKVPCLEHECMMYTHVTMTDPQTGQGRDEYTCSFVLMPMMQIEGARCTRGVQAAVEDSRNEIVKRQDVLNGAVQRARLKQERDVSDFGSDNTALPGG